MTHLQETDFNKLNELLQYTSEFISYFELADTKMMQWRQDIEQHSQTQQQLVQHQLQNLHHELESIIEVLTQVGIERLRQRIEQALGLGETHVNELQKTSKIIFGQINEQQQVLNETLAKHLECLNQHTEQSLIRIDRYLANYDVHQFRRAASESHLQIEKVSGDAIKKSTRLLKLFQWRALALAVTTTVLTAFTVGLYISNELPWETHQKIVNERAAGQALMRAWSGLTPQEKNKILSNQEAENRS
ncbi:MAG: hypothetical protein A3F46_08125 [Legionellales bacterium RIFCSPHIGHO2_12_FULL_42_9]|nr:MAG: hypothetical protein A3F46_08125 [Legionellales bacterium RIFCSPHIGHO2_12_FULL_42_9]